MSTAALVFSSRFSAFARGFWYLTAVFGVAIITLMGFMLLGATLVSWSGFIFGIASALFMLLLCMAPALGGVATLSNKNAFFSANLVIWAFLMSSEGIFFHFVTTQSTEAGHFDPSSVLEALSWIVCFLALALVTAFRPGYLRNLFRGRLKWASIFGVIAVLSCPLSPNIPYSLALAFKLCVVVVTLFAVQDGMDDMSAVKRLSSAMLAGTLTIVTLGLIVPFTGNGPVFGSTGRFGVMIGLSGTAGLLLLWSVLLFVWTKKPRFFVIAVFSLVPMMLAAGKGGIAASFISLLAFFAFLKKPAQALVATLCFATVFTLAIAFTPFGSFMERYAESGNASTLTGRTALWTAVWPEIMKKPIIGHGYRASRFASAEVEGAFAEAGHIHNSYLEVLYNNGIVGLIPVLTMNIIIVVNLARVVRRPGSQEIRCYAAGALALFVHLQTWGLTAPTFGSTADIRFMTFLVLVLLSEVLKSEAARTLSNGNA